MIVKKYCYLFAVIFLLCNYFIIFSFATPTDNNHQCKKKSEISFNPKQIENSECESLIIFDLSKNFTTKDIFDISIKIFLNYTLKYCNGFKYVIIDDNFNECETENGCNITVNECSVKDCDQIMGISGYESTASSYSNVFPDNPVDSSNFNLFLKEIFAKISLCKENLVLLLTNRVIMINQEEIANAIKEYCIEFTTVLLGYQENEEEYDLSNVYKNVPGVTIVNLANFDCLNYLFYCLLPCSNQRPNCMLGDVGSRSSFTSFVGYCDDLSIYTPNANPEDMFHIWYIYDFRDKKINAVALQKSIQDGFNSFKKAYNVKTFRQMGVYLTSPTRPTSMSCEEYECFFYPPFSALSYWNNHTDDIFDDGGLLNEYLDYVPWSGTLTETRKGTTAVIILTDYATTNFLAIRNGETLQGQMFIYNPKAFEYYSKKFKNSTNFHLYSASFDDTVFIHPIQKNDVNSTTSSSISTSTSATSQTVITETTNFIFSTAKNASDLPTSNTLKIIIICSAIFIGLIVLCVGWYVCRKINNSNQKNGQRASQREQLEENLSPIDDEWELTWDKLIIQNEIGSGAFGRIKQGKLRKTINMEEYELEVAIKMPTDLTKNQFLNEVNLMKKISGNINIIKMHGCITSDEQLCLILEFCENSDLLNYIKQIKNNMVNDVKNSLAKEFFRYVWQISHGLQYLATKSIVHRDLAARNILIDSEKNAKITDFGLSIQLLDSTFIIPDRERERLPIKWLAMESFKIYKFSLKTDIWTFGIVLYEMYSFGETPYADIEASDLLQYLEAGNRLMKPEFCSAKIFEIMSKCWIENPFQRPKIDDLIAEFSLLLESSTDEESEPVQTLKQSSDNNSNERF